MAKSMMFENVVVLEMLTRSIDKDGKPLKDRNGNPVSYSTLVCYERGNKYPELIKLSVSAEFLTVATALVGKVCNILAGVFVYNDKMQLHFAEGSPAGKAA